MESIMIEKCRLCEKEELSVYYELDNDRGFLYSCDNCGFIQMPVMPIDELDSVASQESIFQDVDRKTSPEDMKTNEEIGLSGPMSRMAHILREDSIRINRIIKEIIDKNFSSANNLQFIDIGSGYGQHSFSLKKEFPELDFHLLEISRERMKEGIRCFKPNLNDFNFHHALLDDDFASEHSNKFDISFSFHVLEHVYNIKDFIRNMFEITKDGGTIILELPNEDDDLSLLSENYRKIIHFPAHVSHFTKKTLSKLITEAGIERKVDVSFRATQRYGFFNYIDWLRYNKKDKVLSDDYSPRENPTWIEKKWLQTKEDNFTTDSITLILKKHDS
jgi:2-polyprenyl-3-methyl-5-hydroxy-6-metoxy-1,4-benzoquinol methylase